MKQIERYVVRREDVTNSLMFCSKCPAVAVYIETGQFLSIYLPGYVTSIKQTGSPNVVEITVSGKTDSFEVGLI
jgi:hypothetical protein